MMNKNDFIGARVSHKDYGQGTVVDVTFRPADPTLIDVQFETGLVTRFQFPCNFLNTDDEKLLRYAEEITEAAEALKQLEAEERLRKAEEEKRAKQKERRAKLAAERASLEQLLRFVERQSGEDVDDSMKKTVPTYPESSPYSMRGPSLGDPFPCHPISEKNREQIVKYLRDERGVRYLVHFTPVENIPSILKNGLSSIDTLVEKGIPFAATDDERFDFFCDYCCLSVSFPNYKMRCHKSHDKEKKFSLPVLLIDVNALLDERVTDIKCFTTNAATASKTYDPATYDEYESCRHMFDDKVMTEIGTASRKQLDIPEEYTTNPQAEIQFRGTIPPSAIRQIHLTCEDGSRIEQLYNANPELFSMSNDNMYFRYRSDYAFWKKQDKDDVSFSENAIS